MEHTRTKHASLLDVSRSIIALVKPAWAASGLKRLKPSLPNHNPVTVSAALALMIALGILLFDFPLIAGAQGPVGTTFTYQGRLMQSGQYVNGVTCDFQFSLYDAPGTGNPPSGGTQLGPTLSLSALVTNGYFTADLDFGAVFTGTVRYLQVAVRCPAGSGTFALMNERISLNPVPYALYASNVGSFSGSIAWSQIITTSMPSGFRDNIDNDTLASVNCNINQTLRWGGGRWQCADALIYHAQLQNLTADDHPQYLPRDGSRPMEYNLNLNGYNVVGLAAAQGPGDAVRYEQAVLDGDTAGGDLNGSYPNPRVVSLYGHPLTDTMPTTGQVLSWDGAQWRPAPNYPTGPAGNDLRGNYPNPIVRGLQTYPISDQAPQDDQVLTWNASMSQWEPAGVTLTGAAGGDLAGTYPNPIVDGLRNRPVDGAQPNIGQVLGWNGNAWAPANDNTSPTGTAGGDLTGTYPNPTVDGLQGYGVSNTAPAANQVLAYVGGAWTPSALPADSVGMTQLNVPMGYGERSGVALADGGSNVDLYIFPTSFSFTPTANGRCLVNASATILSGGNGYDGDNPYVRTAIQRGSSNSNDAGTEMRFQDVSNGNPDSATATYVWSVYAGEQTTFGCYILDSSGNWDHDESVNCRVSYICQ